MSVNSLLFPNPRQLHCGQINVSGLASNLAMIPPIVTNSTRFCANVYVQRAMFSDATGNIFSPALTISNQASVGNVLTGTGANTADWLLPSVQSSSLVISGSAVVGRVLTGTGAGTADWQLPGTIQGNITSDILTANVINVVDMTVTGTINLTGDITADNITVTGNVIGDTVTATGDVTGDQLVSTVATGTAPIVVASTTLVPNLYVARSALADVATVANALKSATTTVNVSSATAPAANEYLKATSGTAAVWSALPTTFSDTTFSVYDNADNTKQILFNAAGTTGTTTTRTSSQTSSRVITLPDAADTLVGKATSDAFTNKTVTDASNNVIARSLWNGSGGASVSVYAATAPTTGQALIATSPTLATWQTLPTAGTGMIKQIVSTFPAAGGISTAGTTMPYNVQQVITDGAQWMSLAITPTSATSYLKIECQICHSAEGGSTGHDTIVLCKAGVTNAYRQSTRRRWNNNSQEVLQLTYYLQAGDTTAQTWSIRAGNSNGYGMRNVILAIPDDYIIITEYAF